MTASTSCFPNSFSEPWESLGQAINGLSKLLDPISWSDIPKTKEDLLPRTLRNGWQDSQKILKTFHWLASGSRKGYRWIRQASKTLQTVDEECL